MSVTGAGAMERAVAPSRMATAMGWVESASRAAATAQEVAGRVAGGGVIEGDDLFEDGATEGEGAGLVEAHGAGAGEAFEAVAALEEHAATGGAGRCPERVAVGGDDEGAGQADDEKGDGGVERRAGFRSRTAGTPSRSHQMRKTAMLTAMTPRE
jgi:hypothetical protein